MCKFNLLKQFINTFRHSERSEESRHYARNLFGLLARKLDYIITGLPRNVNLARNDRRTGMLGCLQSNYAHRNWILRSLTLPQNDGLWKSSITKKIAFTMAEILLSLTIIGVVAAITLPSLTGNINERTWNTQRKALYARMSQAIALMGSLNGYGIGATESETASNAAKAFVTNGLAKVYKINNICDAEHLSDCGIPSKITTSSATSKIDVPINIANLNTRFNMNYTSENGTCYYYSQINTYAAAFETQNGESVIAYYNPFCSSNLASPVESSYSNLLQPTMCVNFVYDLNGKKGPNTVGKDIGFMTAFYPTDSQVVAPNPIKIERAYNDDRFQPESFCRNKYGEDARAANLEELKSLFVNLYLVHPNGYSDGVVSKTKNNSGTYYGKIGFYAGNIKYSTPTTSANTYRNFYCIK